MPANRACKFHSLTLSLRVLLLFFEQFKLYNSYGTLTMKELLELIKQRGLLKEAENAETRQELRFDKQRRIPLSVLFVSMCLCYVFVQ